MEELEKLAGEKWPGGVSIEAREHFVRGTTQLIFRFPNGYGASVIPEYEYHPGDGPRMTTRDGVCEIAMLEWEDDEFWFASGEQYVGFEWDVVQRFVPVTDAIRVIERIGMLPDRRKELEE